MFTTSSQLDRRERIIPNTNKQYAKFTDACVAKQSDTDGLLVLVSELESSMLQQANDLAKPFGLQLYATKNQKQYILGRAKRDRSNDIVCELA